MEHVPIEKWGKDHLSTLLYLETRAVDHKGKIDNRNMRENGVKYPTRLRNGENLTNHDDWDCLWDMEAHGVLINKGTGLHPVVELTDLGWRYASQLRRLKAEGKPLYAFDPEK